MSSGDVWSWDNAIDGNGATINSSTGDAGLLALNNLRDPRVSKIWRAGGMPVTLTVTLPTTGGVSVVGLFGTNLRDVGNVTIRLIGVGGSTAWEQAVPVSGRRPNVVYLLRDAFGAVEPVNAVAVEIVADGPVPFEVGRLWVGGANWQPEVGHIVGSRFQVLDLTKRTVTPVSGSFLHDRGARRLAFTAMYDALTPAEYGDILIRRDMDYGLAAQTLFLPNPDVYDLSHFAILGYIKEMPEMAFVASLRGAETMTIIQCG